MKADKSPPNIGENPLEGETSSNYIDGNMLRIEMFRWNLEQVIHCLQDEMKNPLVEYLNLDKNIVQNCRINTESSIINDKDDVSNQDFLHTFAPDIVIQDSDGMIIAVIQLAILSQNSDEIASDMAAIQMVELMKYHVEHEVPVALINIRYEDGGVAYDWLVLGKANIPPPPIMLLLIDSTTGLDPILPKNALSAPFIKDIYNEILVNDGFYDFEKKMASFQDLVNKSQLAFEKLPFDTSYRKKIDVKYYWRQIVRKYNELELIQVHKMEFEEFHKILEELILIDYLERLKKIGLNIK